MAKGELVDKSGLLFHPLTSNGKKLRLNGSFIYSRLHELLLDYFRVMSYLAEQVGIHSLRAGGATAAAGSGVPNKFFKRHGRWRSETTKDGYVKNSVEE